MIPGTVDSDAATPRTARDTAAPPITEDAAAPTADAAAQGEDADDDDAAATPATDALPTFPRRPSCPRQPPPVVNGELDDPASGSTIPGWQVQINGAATAQWDPISGYAGTGALSIKIPDDAAPGTVVVRQSLTLEPFTGYNVRARIAGDNLRPRGEGLLLFEVAVRNGGRTYAIGPRKQDRTDIDYAPYASDFGTGPDGRVELEVRSAGGTGHFLVDSISVTCSDRSQRYAGKDLTVTVYDNHVQSATPTSIEKVVTTLEQALASYADLTGTSDAAMKASAFPLVAAVTESRGNPALWGDTVTAALWSTPGYLPPGLAGALARNFDRPAWQFDDDFAGLTVYYAAETGNLTWSDEASRGRASRRAYEGSYAANWKPGGCADGAGHVYKNILLRDKIGWEPFKKTFRYFAALAPAEVPATRWDKLRRWYDKLGEAAGMDVWATFTPAERALIEARYNPPPDPAPRALAALPATTLMIPLAAAQWESATARDRPARYRLPSDCPMLSASGPVDNGLWAFPYSQYVYRLGKRWKRLRASFSLQAGETGSAVFIVRGDGHELAKSPAVRDAMPRPLDLDVSTVDRLELVVTDAGDGNRGDGALWIDPRLTR
jgi:hypothetical protein